MQEAGEDALHTTDEGSDGESGSEEDGDEEEEEDDEVVVEAE